MTQADSAAEQRLAIRLQMYAQRMRIAERLGPASVAASPYPRSMTMRILSQRPDLVLQLALRITRAFGSRAPAPRSP